MDVIIIDDEQSARDVLSNLLRKGFPELKIKATCKDVPEAVEQIKRHQPDAIFIDVQMPNYAGYEIIDFFDQINFEIIFITAFDQYAIKAFELNAIDYLVKPISRMRLAESIERLKVKTNQKGVEDDYKLLVRSLKEKSSDKLVIPEAGNKRIISVTDIVAVEAEGSYSIVRLLGGRNILVSKGLKYFETTLTEMASFFRTHKSWIVNLEHVQAYNKTEHLILMKNNIQVKLSKYRITTFEEVFRRK
jgi:two-component system LytT family response regulator